MWRSQAARTAGPCRCVPVDRSRGYGARAGIGWRAPFPMLSQNHPEGAVVIGVW